MPSDQGSGAPIHRHIYETYVLLKSPKELNVPGSVRTSFRELAEQDRYAEMNLAPIFLDVLAATVQGAQGLIVDTPAARAVMKASLGLG